MGPALPYGKSSLMLFMNIFFYNSFLVSPPSPQLRSSLLEKMAYVREKEEDLFFGGTMHVEDSMDPYVFEGRASK
jgi:hypothetical protein